MQNQNQPSLVWSKRYSADLDKLGIVKPFALDRGQVVIKALEKELGQPVRWLEPEEVREEDLLLVHTADYLRKLNKTETWIELYELKEHEYFPERAQRPLNDLYGDIRVQCGGSILATELALAKGLAASLGGGYHHAYADEGRGFCPLNDIAVSIRSMQKQKRIKTAMVVDLDFHQGDGTARIFQNDASVFTLSVHSEEGWPEEKQVSSLDVGIVESEAHRYLELAQQAIETALVRFQPDLVVYVAGSDPYELDALPGSSFIKLPLEQMIQRDRMVLDKFKGLGIPLVMLFAGGYGPDVWEVHYHAVRHMLQCNGDLSGVSGLSV